ncbi:aminoglycoside phosphotransferase family protein [Streptomyces antarcticus]|uniref:aminoglycoside phosphotransferase family protein n=1 Tax=Streptomyces antarcticus TaxID=2996458 RepID=UPI00226EB119|nr:MULTISPECIES: aminoglycoside phosphotransferase family protein [unclassified Streptomyces]MCY0945960.1 hydroxyurea phosphotransferase [Streptomyces sp. H34-AA3]MCZ4084839.1 hydroxyurea phosphotransferase [Streptomyces sp. H34-S5]
MVDRVEDIEGIGKVAVAEIPEGLVEAQATYGGAAGREFIAGLPALAGRFLARWELRRTGPGMHGVAALVLPVERSDGTPAALKLQPVDEETVGEPVALRAWDGDGAVRLWEHDAASGAMLLERLDERRPLTAVAERDPREAVAVVAGLLARLTATPAPAGLRGLGAMAAGMLEDVPGALRRLADGRDRRVLADCAAALAEVAGEPGDRLLHWDLHYGNVLGGGAGGREEWLAIDPKPLAGDAGFELLPALVNNFAAGEVRWRFDLLAEVLGLDRERARAWTLGRVLQNCLWEVQDGEERLPHEQRAVAELLMGRDV